MWSSSRVPKLGGGIRVRRIDLRGYGNITGQIPYLEDGSYLRALKGPGGDGAEVPDVPATSRGRETTFPAGRGATANSARSTSSCACTTPSTKPWNASRRLCRASSVPHSVCVVDDASSILTHNRISEFMRDKPWMQIVRNAENMGYTKSANRGIFASEADWVILLNSDTIVTKGWIEGLLECAVSHPNTACVGPVSNAATYQSVPEVHDVGRQMVRERAAAEHERSRSLNGFLRANSLKAFPSVPLLNGFCTLIKRDVFVELGGFNEAAFPAGYGEENDWCARVARSPATACRWRITSMSTTTNPRAFGAEPAGGTRQGGIESAARPASRHRFRGAGAAPRRHGGALAHLRDRLRALYKIGIEGARMNVTFHPPGAWRRRRRPFRGSGIGGAEAIRRAARDCDHGTHDGRVSGELSGTRRRGRRHRGLPGRQGPGRRARSAATWPWRPPTNRFTSCGTAKPLCSNKKLRTAYYVQDYEPFFVRAGDAGMDARPHVLFGHARTSFCSRRRTGSATSCAPTTASR
jgi:hypothetical protein